MNSYNDNKVYFKNKHDLFCSTIKEIDFNDFDDQNLCSFICNELNLYNNDFEHHLKSVYESTDFEPVIIVNDKNNNVFFTIDISTISLIQDSVNMFLFKSYYNSLISVPIWDYILNKICSEYLFISHSTFKAAKNKNIDENVKSSSTLIKNIINDENYNVNPDMVFLFTNNYLNYDIRSSYSHCFFRNKEHIKAISHLYHLTMVNNLILNNYNGVIHEKN